MVRARLAQHRVVARAAVEPVVALAADHRFVAGAAREHVRARRQPEHLDGGERIAPRVARARRGVHDVDRDAGRAVVGHRVASRAAVQEVGARPTDQHVGAVLTEQAVVARAPFEPVVTDPSGEPVVARLAQQRVVARAAIEPVVVVAAPKRVRAGLSVERVVAAPAIQHVVLRATEQAIGAPLARQHVVARIADQHIVAAAGEQRVVARQAAQGLRAVRAQDRVGPVRAGMAVRRRSAVDDRLRRVLLVNANLAPVVLTKRVSRRDLEVGEPVTVHVAERRELGVVQSAPIEVPIQAVALILPHVFQNERRGPAAFAPVDDVDGPQIVLDAPAPLGRRRLPIIAVTQTGNNGEVVQTIAVHVPQRRDVRFAVAIESGRRSRPVHSIDDAKPRLGRERTQPQAARGRSRPEGAEQDLV